MRWLARRWEVPVTLVVAGPGLGKTTALAQAVRAHALTPAGIEAWVGCRPGHEQAEVCAAAVAAALGHAPTGDPGTDVLEALRRHAPLDVCHVLDDVHEIPAGSSSARLLSEVVRSLPANAHPALAGRGSPPVPLARLRAADRVVEIAPDELLFSARERARLAAHLGRDPAVADRYGGWPALVRLALAVGDDVSLEYAREEVVAGLRPADRRCFYALVAVGTGDDDLVARITGGPVDLAALARRVPLVDRVDGTRVRAHDLWGEALARVALDLVASTLSVLLTDTAARWLDQVAPGDAEHPQDAAAGRRRRPRPRHRRSLGRRGRRRGGAGLPRPG